MELRSERGKNDLADAIGRILDKGLVINADIAVSVTGTELLGIKIRAALASFETAARYGLEFPSGTNLTTETWRNIEKERADCPNCGNRMGREELVRRGCYICGWTSPLKEKVKEVWMKERTATIIYEDPDGEGKTEGEVEEESEGEYVEEKEKDEKAVSVDGKKGKKG